jgi:hypothetical protein
MGAALRQLAANRGLDLLDLELMSSSLGFDVYLKVRPVQWGAYHVQRSPAR